jgi:hypothetical protein
MKVDYTLFISSPGFLKGLNIEFEFASFLALYSFLILVWGKISKVTKMSLREQGYFIGCFIRSAINKPFGLFCGLNLFGR